MSLVELSEENHKARSDFIRSLIQNPINSNSYSSICSKKIPVRIIQYWHNLDRLPDDVNECLDTWQKLEKQGFERLLFDNNHAKDFINQKLGTRYLNAYESCYHPAMQSDYFRLCYILVEGGCYIDADDVYNGANLRFLYEDGRLKTQPLCYDTATNTMVSPQLFTRTGITNESWIFYFNNNPLIASGGHPIIERALSQATLLLERDTTNGLPEIQSTTGPGNLSKSIFDIITENIKMKDTIQVLYNWEEVAKSKWDLNYRNDSRNWRNSNCQGYIE